MEPSSRYWQRCGHANRWRTASFDHGIAKKKKECI